MNYLLDTDVVSNQLKRAPSSLLARRLAVVNPTHQYTSAITVGEMIYGALRSSRADDLMQRLENEI